MGDRDNRTSNLGQERDPRVFFAAERTTLAWIRTGITMMAFGFVVARFGVFLHELTAGRSGAAPAAAPVDPIVPGTSASLWAGVALMLFGVWVNIAAAARHFRFRKRFEKGEPFLTPRGTLIVFLSVLLALLGAGLTAYLLAIGR